MAASTESSKLPSSDSASLKDLLTSELPSGFNCKVRYLRTQPYPCDPLFSALPGQTPEKTRLASHFLTASVDSTSLPQHTAGSESYDVISFGIEVLIYTTKNLTTLFVSKVDSTSYVPRHKPSPIKTTVTTFLRWLTDRERRKRPHRQIVISLFARAQAQYLFPGSSDSSSKHVLDDRQLIKWWARVLDPIFPSKGSASAVDGIETQYQGYLTVPGYDKNELRSFLPPGSASASGNPNWKPGNPLKELAATRKLPEFAPPRCLLPRFPDDPKARFIQDLDDEVGLSQVSQTESSPRKRSNGMWKSVRDLDRFWEAMEFRQECSSGRLVGFLWLVISPKQRTIDDIENDATAAENGESQDSVKSPLSSKTVDSIPMQHAEPRESSQPRKRKRGRLTGPIITRPAQIKGSSSTLPEDQIQTDSGDGIVVTKEGYEAVMQTLLRLDFSSLDVAIRSTAKWIAEATSCAKGNLGFEVSGVAKSLETTVSHNNNEPAAVNDLGGMIKKKRKTNNSTLVESHPAEDKQLNITSNEQSAVNILSGGMIRKKPKPSTTT